MLNHINFNVSYYYVELNVTSNHYYKCKEKENTFVQSVKQSQMRHPSIGIPQQRYSITSI